MQVSGFLLAPRPTARGVRDGARAVRLSAPVSAQVRDGYASAAEPDLRRVRLTTARRPGSALLDVTWARSR